MTTPRKTTGKRTTQATPRTHDERKQELLQTFGLLSERAQAEIAALISALLDSQAGLLLSRDEKSLRAALAKSRATNNTQPIDRWLRKHYYLPLTDSPYQQRNRAALVAQDRAHGARDGE